MSLRSVRPRVLYSAFDVVPSPKGSGTHVRHFVRSLVRAGCDVLLVTPWTAGARRRARFQGARHLRVGRAEGSFLERALDFGERVVAAGRRWGPFDVAHFRSFWSGLPLLLARDTLGAGPRPLRLLFEANSLSSVELPFHYPGLRGHALVAKLRALESLTLREADAVVCVSRVSRAFLEREGARRERLHVIPNGIDRRRFRPTPLPAPAPGRVPEALYLGTLADWQGLHTLLEAWPRVLARRPVRLRLVGRGRARQRKELSRRLRKLGLEPHVSLEPPVAHRAVPGLIAQADLALAPLEHDERNVVQGCCPLKLLEYLACGRPVVASNLPVVRELVRGERQALLVPPGAPDALAAAVLRLLDEPRTAQRLARRGAAHVHRRFAWARAGRRLLRLYARLLRA